MRVHQSIKAQRSVCKYRRRRATWHSPAIMCAEIINDRYRGADVERNDIYAPWLKRLPRNVGINFYLRIGIVAYPRVSRRFVISANDRWSADTPDAAQITLAAISAIINYSHVRKSSVDAFSGLIMDQFADCKRESRARGGNVSRLRISIVIFMGAARCFIFLCSYTQWKKIYL